MVISMKREKELLVLQLKWQKREKDLLELDLMLRGHPLALMVLFGLLFLLLGNEVPEKFCFAPRAPEQSDGNLAFPAETTKVPTETVSIGSEEEQPRLSQDMSNQASLDDDITGLDHLRLSEDGSEQPQEVYSETEGKRTALFLFFPGRMDRVVLFSDIVPTLYADEELPIVTPSSIDPALLRRYNELYDAVTRARRDNKKKYDIFCLTPWLFNMLFFQGHPSYHFLLGFFLLV